MRLPITLGAQAPKRSGQPDAGQRRIRFVQCLSAPVGAQNVRVPSLGKLPALLRGHGGTARQLPRSAPAVDVLFRPEDEHRRSGERDVVPPLGGRHAEVDDALASSQLTVSDIEDYLLIAVAAPSGDGGVGVKRRRDAERIPNADAPIRATEGANPEVGGDGAEWVRRPNVCCPRRQDKGVPGGEALYRLFDLGLRPTKRRRDLTCARQMRGLCGLAEDVEAHIPIQRFRSRLSCHPFHPPFFSVADDSRPDKRVFGQQATTPVAVLCFAPRSPSSPMSPVLLPLGVRRPNVHLH